MVHLFTADRDHGESEVAERSVHIDSEEIQKYLTEQELAKLKERERVAAQSAAQASKAWESERQKMLEQMKQLQAASEAAGQHASATQQAKSDMSGLARELEEVKAQNAELLAEKHGMEEAVTSLVRQTQELRVENEEQMAFLAQARDTIGALKKEREASAAAGGGNDNNAAGDAAKGNSLLDELEANMDSKIKAQEARPARPTRPETGDGAPENCEEYFLIAQTAVKIGLAMKFPHRSDEVFRVRGIDLYYKCLNSHVPFHQWHLWISRTLHAMLKGDVKPAAIMENSRRAREGSGGGEGGGASGSSGGAAAGGAEPKKKGWIASLFN